MYFLSNTFTFIEQFLKTGILDFVDSDWKGTRSLSLKGSQVLRHTRVQYHSELWVQPPAMENFL